jgi:polar amino acid transport system substrate-binding protein
MTSFSGMNRAARRVLNAAARPMRGLGLVNARGPAAIRGTPVRAAVVRAATAVLAVPAVTAAAGCGARAANSGGMAVGGTSVHGARVAAAGRSGSHAGQSQVSARRVAAPACDPTASSLAPDGPPAVTPGSWMATIRARGYLIAGVDQNTYHFGYLNPRDNEIEGFDIDMVQAVARAIFGSGYSSHSIEYKAISDAQRIPDVQNGSVDIVAHTMTITCARLQQVDFSSVYYNAEARLLVLKPKTGSPPDLPALGREHQKVCATTGSDSVAIIEHYHAIPVQVQYWTDCLVLLQQGQVAGITTDNSILFGLAAQDPFTEVVGGPLEPEPYGLAISKQHPEFVRFVNGVLAQIESDGQWQDDYRQWVGTPVPEPPAARYAG